jgi:hypothetical protein
MKKKPWGGLVSKFYFELFAKSSWNPEHFAWQCIYVVPWLIHPLEKRSRCGLRTSILYSHAPHAISATQSMMCRTNSKGVTRRWTPPGTKGIYLSFHLQWSWKGNWQKAILFLAPCCSCLPTESRYLHRMHWGWGGGRNLRCVWFLRRGLVHPKISPSESYLRKSHRKDAGFPVIFRTIKARLSRRCWLSAHLFHVFCCHAFSLGFPVS